MIEIYGSFFFFFWGGGLGLGVSGLRFRVYREFHVKIAGL